MPSDRPTGAALPLALLVCVLVVADVAATAGIAVGEPLMATAPQDPAASGATLALDRPTRRLIQQGLRNEGFDPGTPDGLFGPRTRAAIRDWQQSRGASPTGYLNGAEAELLRTAAAPPPTAPGAPPPLQVVPAGNLTALPATAAPASEPTETDPSRPSSATVAAEEVNPQNTAERNTRQGPRASGRNGTVQLPPEILIDRHLVRAERLLAGGDPTAALQAMNGILALQEEHDLVLQDGFDFEYAQVAYAAGRTETAIASLNEYLVAAGREGELYREALELLDSAEVRLEREVADRRRARRRAEAERRRVARWPPGHVFRDCETCPEMVVLPGSVLALGRYEVTLGEYRAFAAATGGGAGGGCRGPDDGDYSWRNPPFPQTDRHPVTCVSWHDAQAYLSWLNRTTRAPYRLATLEELVGAADSSQPGCYRRRTGHEGTCAVGTYGPNDLGLSDLLGNVAEWTSRCPGGDCGRRWIHGSHWANQGGFLGPNTRGHRRTAFRAYLGGFRVARALE